MFLSLLPVDVGNDPDRPGRLWLRNLYRVHQRLCMAFPSKSRKSDDPGFLQPFKPDDFPELRHLADQPADEIDRTMLKNIHAPRDSNQGFLFRIDPHPGGQVVILVQSAIRPDWDYAFHNAAYLLAAPAETKIFDPCFAKDQQFRFRLVANPTRKVGTKRGPDGKTKIGPDGKKCHGKRVPVPADNLYEWLARRAESAGFSIGKDSTTVQPSYISVNKKRSGNGQRLRSVRYDGILQVTDPDCFQKTIVQGIGPGKAFGFGLLSVLPVDNPRQAEVI